MGNETGLKERVEALHGLVIQGENLRAIDEFYHEEIVRQENDQAPRFGKALGIRDEMENLERVTECTQTWCRWQSMKRSNWSWLNGPSTFRYQDSGERKRLNEVSVQRWKEERIIYERFYYAGFLDE